MASSILLAAILSCISNVPANAVTYEFNFDDVDDGMVMAPLVGFGAVSFDGGALADGTYPMDDFSNIDISFNFSSLTSFSEMDVVTPTNEVLFVILNGGQSFNFSNTNGSPGAFGGAIDFIKDDMTFGLSTEPPGTGGNLDRYFVAAMDNSFIFFGNYEGTLVPEPSGLVLVAPILLLLLTRRKRLTAA